MTATAPAIDVDALLRRLHLPTVRRLYPDLAQRAEQDGLGYRDFLALLMAEEVAHRTQTRIQRCVRRAHFPFLKTIDEYDFTLQAGVRLALLGSALSPEFVTQGHTLIFSGPSGTGKTHLAIAVAYRAIQNGFDALFTTATAVIEELSTATREGKLREPLVSYTHPDVLVIDEVGYLGYGPDAANVLFQIVNDRYLHRRPMIFTTNKPLGAWGRVLHDPDLAEAILDRVLERGRHFELRGPSYRTRHLKLDLHHDLRPPSAVPTRLSGNHRPEFPEPTNLKDDPRAFEGGNGQIAQRGAVLPQGLPDTPRVIRRAPDPYVHVARRPWQAVGGQGIGADEQEVSALGGQRGQHVAEVGIQHRGLP